MAKTEVKISEIPEEVTADGLKIYGPELGGKCVYS